MMAAVSRVCVRPLSTSLIPAAENESSQRLSQSAPKPFSEMPGLKGLPVLGNAVKFIRQRKLERGGEDSHFHQLRSKFGPIFRVRMIGNTWIVATSSPEAVETLFRSEGQHPSRGTFEDNFKWIYKKTNTPELMFFSKGASWKKIRSAAAKQVVPRRVGNFVEPLSIIAEELLSHLESLMDKSGNVENVNPELYKWAFQGPIRKARATKKELAKITGKGVSYFVYGDKINVYSKTDAIHQQFIDAATDYLAAISKMTQALPFYKLFPTKPFRVYRRSVQRLQVIGKQILDQRYKEIKDAISSGTVDETKPVGLLDQWLIEGKYTEEEALFQSYDMLSAGIDTTTNVACFMLYEIAKQPELQERLVQEISSVVGDKEHPSWEDLQKMTLVRNCVKETMRMYIPTGATARILDKDAVLSGYQVPAGTMVVVNMVSMGRDEQIFEEAKSFRPDRWNKDASGKIHPFSSIPFGFGPRSCYGRRLAELELYLLLTKMLPKYRITTNIENLAVKLILILKPAVPIHLNFQLRS